MVADKEPFIGSQMHKDLERIFAAGNILVAHNAKFDADILRREGLVIPPFIDTYKVAYHLDPEGTIPRYALQYLRYYFNLEVENAPAHDALGDIRVLERIFEHLYVQMEKTIGDAEKILQVMLEVSAQPILLRKFNFGKYIDRKISEIAREDSGYLAWLLNQKIMARKRGEANDEDWIYTLDYYLNPKQK
jgi:exodeoxyribonuclease X